MFTSASTQYFPHALCPHPILLCTSFLPLPLTILPHALSLSPQWPNHPPTTALSQPAPPLAYTPSLNLTHILHHNSPCHTHLCFPSQPTTCFTWLTQTCLATNLHVCVACRLWSPHGYTNTSTYSPYNYIFCPHIYLPPIPSLPHMTHLPILLATTTCLKPPYGAWSHAYAPSPSPAIMPACLISTLPHHYPLLPQPAQPRTLHLIPTCLHHVYHFAPNRPATCLFCQPATPPQADTPCLKSVLFNYSLGPNRPHVTTNLVPTCLPHGYPTLCPTCTASHMTICLTQSHSTA